MTGKIARKQAGACAAKTVEPSQWSKQRMTRQQRLYRNMLKPASAELVESQPKAAKWFCLNVFDGSEFTVESRLTDGGVKALVPREECVTIKKGEKITTDRAFFEGYVLVKIVPSDLAFQRLRKVKGVRDFLGNEKGYHVVRDREIGRYVPADLDRMPADTTIGDGCRVMCDYGLFAGLECLVLQVAEKSRKKVARLWIVEYGKEVRNVPLAFLRRL